MNVTIIRRDEEERYMNMTEGNCRYGPGCTALKVCGARIPGTSIFKGACVLCCRNFGPAYANTDQDYPDSALRYCQNQSKQRQFFPSVIFKPEDYMVTEDGIQQFIPRPCYVETCVWATMCAHLPRVEISLRAFHVTVCKCRTRVKRDRGIFKINEKLVLTRVNARRSVGVAPKSTVFIRNTVEICAKCRYEVMKIRSDDHGVICIQDVVFIPCFICEAVTIHPMELTSFVVCDGCDKHFKNMSSAVFYLCKVCGKKTTLTEYCKKHVITNK